MCYAVLKISTNGRLCLLGSCESKSVGVGVRGGKLRDSGNVNDEADGYMVVYTVEMVVGTGWRMEM